MNMHAFYDEIISYINELKKTALQEEYFYTFKNLLSNLSEVNTDEFNKSERIDYFSSAVSLYTSYEILFLTKIEQNIMEINPGSIINYISKNEYARLGFDKGKECNGNEEKFDKVFGGIQIPFVNEYISYMKIYNKIKNENLDNQYYEKTFSLMQKAALFIQNEIKTVSFEKEIKTDADLDSLIVLLYNCHEIPESFFENIFPLRQFIKLFQSEDCFYTKISKVLLDRKLKAMNIPSSVKTDLSDENCLMYLQLVKNYGFVTSSMLRGLFSIILNEIDSEKLNTEMAFRYGKNLLQIFPDFLLRYPGFAFYLYDAIKEFDFNTLARAFDCVSDIYYEEIEIYEKACNYIGHEISPIQSVLTSDVFMKDDFNYEKNVNQNLLCILLFIGLLAFLSSDADKYSEEIKLILVAIEQKKINQFSCLIPILNKLAEQMKLSKSQPFCELKFNENNTSDFNAKNIAINILYMLSHINSLDAIYHEINFVREQQRAVLDCVPNRKFRYDEEDIDNVIAAIKRNKETLEEIDFGFPVDFLQEHEFSKMAGSKKGAKRKITCKLFSESDKKFDNIHKYRSRGKYKIDYEENYRVSYRNRFSNYYLYMDRNRYTHYSNDLVIEKLLDDSLPLTSLFDAIDETLNFLGPAIKSEINDDEKVLYTFYAALMNTSLYRILCKFAPEEKVPPEKCQNMIEAIFYKKMDNDINTDIAVLKKKYRQRASEFSLEQNISKKDLDFLRKSFEFAFIVDNDFLSKCKEQVILYLMYMSIKLSTL